MSIHAKPNGVFLFPQVISSWLVSNRWLIHLDLISLKISFISFFLRDEGLGHTCCVQGFLLLTLFSGSLLAGSLLAGIGGPYGIEQGQPCACAVPSCRTVFSCAHLHLWPTLYYYTQAPQVLKSPTNHFFPNPSAAILIQASINFCPNYRYRLVSHLQFFPHQIYPTWYHF